MLLQRLFNILGSGCCYALLLAFALAYRTPLAIVRSCDVAAEPSFRPLVIVILFLLVVRHSLRPAHTMASIIKTWLPWRLAMPIFVPIRTQTSHGYATNLNARPVNLHISLSLTRRELGHFEAIVRRTLIVFMISVATARIDTYAPYAAAAARTTTVATSCDRRPDVHVRALDMDKAKRAPDSRPAVSSYCTVLTQSHKGGEWVSHLPGTKQRGEAERETDISI